MKKLFILFLLSSTATYVFAQKDASAKTILSQVSAKYKQYDVVKTDFEFTLNNQQANVTETQAGSLIARPKANKFKVTLTGASAKQDASTEIISDGKTQWTYNKKDNEVQVNAVDNSGEGINPAQIFTIYDHGFKYIYNGEVKIGGKLYQEIDLTPDDIKKSYFKIRLEIDKGKKEIFSALIFDNNGNRYKYTLRSFVPNIQVPDNTFSFDPKAHKGIEVVDLR